MLTCFLALFLLNSSKFPPLYFFFFSFIQKVIKVTYVIQLTLFDFDAIAIEQLHQALSKTTLSRLSLEVSEFIYIWST